MKAEDVDAALVEKARAVLLRHAPDVNAELRPDGSEDPDMAAYVEGWHDAWAAVPDLLAAVLPEIQAQALRDEADRAHTYHFSTGDRVEPVHSERARHLLYERAARLTTTTDYPGWHPDGSGKPVLDPPTTKEPK